MWYTMTFVLSPDLDYVLLLKKASPLYANQWSVPGGKVEPGETLLQGAVRELEEETALVAAESDMRKVMDFDCNCDPTEPEHRVAVYATIKELEEMASAQGTEREPLQVVRVSVLPENSVWYLNALLTMVIGRMKQPLDWSLPAYKLK